MEKALIPPQVLAQLTDLPQKALRDLGYYRRKDGVIVQINLFIVVNRESSTYGSVFHTEADCKTLASLRPGTEAVRVSPKELRMLNKKGTARIETKCTHCIAICKRRAFEARCEKEIAKIEAVFAEGEEQYTRVISDRNRTLFRLIEEKGWVYESVGMIKPGLLRWRVSRRVLL